MALVASHVAVKQTQFLCEGGRHTPSNFVSAFLQTPALSTPNPRLDETLRPKHLKLELPNPKSY